MTTSSRHRRRRLRLIEDSIARVRLGAAALCYLVVLFGSDDARSYRSLALIVITVAAAYSIAMALPRSRLRPEVSTALDLAFCLSIMAVTGAGRSIVIGILFVVVGASALRFPPRVARTIAIGGSVGAAAIILVVPRPELAGATRAELALGWSATLLLAAMLIALLSDLELQDHADLITERERAASLIEQDSARRRTLSMVAHDLTPPLAAVEGIARTLHDPGATLGEEDRHEALAILVEQSGHLRSFARSIRDVANAGDLSRVSRTQVTAIDLSEFLASISRMQSFGPDREVVFEAIGDLQPIESDPERLRRVITNLIDNAVRHSPAGHPVHVTASSDAEHVSIHVVDSGDGVDQRHLESIFSPTWQGPGKVGEAGLGLWIVAELTNELGGSVTARSSTGSGLDVEVRLPLT